MIFLNENTLHEEANDFNDADAVSLGLEPGLEAGLVIEGMSSNIFHTITEAVLMADAKEYALRARAALAEQSGNKTEAQALLEKADALQEGALSDMWGKIKNAFVTMWNWIKGIFKDFFKWINTFLMDSKAFAKKYKKDFDDYKGKLKADWEFKGYKFPSISGGVNQFTSFEFVDSRIAKINEVLNGSAEDVVKYANTATHEKDDAISEDRGKIRAALLKKSGTLADDDFRKELKITVYGSEDKDDLKASDIPATLMADLEQGNKPIKGAQELQKQINDKFNKAIQAINKIEAKVTKDATPADATKKSAVLTRLVSELRFELGLANTVISAFIGGYRAYMAQCKAIVSRVITYRKVGVKESTDTGVLDELLAMIQ
jgi:hypothetical protein